MINAKWFSQIWQACTVRGSSSGDDRWGPGWRRIDVGVNREGRVKRKKRRREKILSPYFHFKLLLKVPESDEPLQLLKRGNREKLTERMKQIDWMIRVDLVDKRPGRFWSLTMIRDLVVFGDRWYKEKMLLWVAKFHNTGWILSKLSNICICIFLRICICICIC